ncbi:uncharacterized protein LOC143543631 [Bidens hawaiensis]|uniref:uncharacterized protein LOC143543631 n=1 Tax=Bidens hawaiensis TaxID=980011 RepID=UPI004048F038
MLSDSKLPMFFRCEAINAACFIQNRVIIKKRLNKTPYEIYYKIKPQVNYFKTFGCPCTLLHIGAHPDPKFVEKAYECYFVGYVANKTVYRVYNKKTKLIVESFNVDWKELNVIDARTGLDWLLDYDFLFKQFHGMYTPPPATTQVPYSYSSLLPLVAPPVDPLPENNQVVDNHASQTADSAEMVEVEDVSNIDSDDSFQSSDNVEQHQPKPMADLQAAPSVVEYVATPPSTGETIQVAATIEEPAAGDSDNTATTPINTIVVPYENLSVNLQVEPVTIVDDIPHMPIHRNHPTVNIIATPYDGIQTRSKSGKIEGLQMVLMENSWVEAMKNKVLPFNNLHFWRLVKKLQNKRHIGTRWVFRNKKYDKMLEAIRVFLAYASYMNFNVYQMDVKTAFLYEKEKEEIYMKQPPGFEDPGRLKFVYRLDKALYGLHQAPHARLCREFVEVMQIRFEMSSLGEMTFFLDLQVEQKEDEILIHQEKYVRDIVQKFGFKDSSPFFTVIATRPVLALNPSGTPAD